MSNDLRMPATPAEALQALAYYAQQLETTSGNGQAIRASDCANIAKVLRASVDVLTPVAHDHP